MSKPRVAYLSLSTEPPTIVDGDGQLFVGQPVTVEAAAYWTAPVGGRMLTEAEVDELRRKGLIP